MRSFTIHGDTFNHFHHSRNVFHQYAVDMPDKMESEMLCFNRNNQKQMWSENYIHLWDAVNNDVASSSKVLEEKLDMCMKGHRMPWTTYVTILGQSPSWHLHASQSIMKLKTFPVTKDIHDLLGKVFRWTMEWQKWWLPHAYIQIWMAKISL